MGRHWHWNNPDGEQPDKPTNELAPSRWTWADVTERGLPADVSEDELSPAFRTWRGWNALDEAERERCMRDWGAFQRSVAGRGIEERCQQLSDAAIGAAIAAYDLARVLKLPEDQPPYKEWLRAGRHLLEALARLAEASDELRLMSPAFGKGAWIPMRERERDKRPDGRVDERKGKETDEHHA